MNNLTGADRQKAKLAMLFSALGLVGFLLNLFAGFGLWAYAGSREAAPPTYDRFVGELRATDTAGLPRFATEVFEKWSACETTRGGMTEVAIHAMITSSVVAIALFLICLVISAQLYARLGRVVGAQSPPQPPDPVDETWKSR
jgi:hypothetical protein